MSLKILIVEDDKNTNEVLRTFLLHEGYSVDSAFCGEDGWRLFEKEEYHLLILDVMLPGMSGIDLLKKVRAISQVPVIMLTALGDEVTQLMCFEYKVDEYVVKPFSPMILVKRVGVLMERLYPKNNVVTIGGCEFDFAGYSVKKEGEAIAFTTKEIEIVKALYQNRSRVLSREQLIDLALGTEYEVLDRTIDTHIKNIRKKLGTECIQTVKGVGYKLE